MLKAEIMATLLDTKSNSNGKVMYFSESFIFDLFIK